jgi:citrate lyase subunit beta/citryl-CoA lyase
MRSLLIVPGGDQTKLAKALASEADALIVDLAGADAARAAALFLAEARRRAPRPRLYVRVSPLDSGRVDADLDAVMPEAPDGIALPQCRDGASVQQLAAKLAVREAEYGLADGATRILAFAGERARGLFGFAAYRRCSARLAGLAWGAEALAADLGAETARLPDGAWTGAFALARTLTLIGAAAAEVAAIDAAFADVDDREGLRAEALAARRDGFAAKLALHPSQVAVINQIFAR